MRRARLRGELPSSRAPRQVDVLAAYVAAGGSVPGAAASVGIRPSTAKRHLADRRARLGLSTEQLIYLGRAEGWLMIPSLETDQRSYSYDHAVEHEARRGETAAGEPRRGARSKRDLDPAHLHLLNAGMVQSRTHVEQMAMSSSTLLRRAFPDLDFDVARYEAVTFIGRLRLTGSLLRARFGEEIDRPDVSWISDTVRGWLAMSIASDGARPLADVIAALLPYARDHHFAVREWAWLAARPLVGHQLQEALRILAVVARSSVPFERRFSIELTRPRSVWGTHIPDLKAAPEQATDLLGAVRCDPSGYVRTAVAARRTAGGN